MLAVSALTAAPNALLRPQSVSVAFRVTTMTRSDCSVSSAELLCQDVVSVAIPLTASFAKSATTL